MAVKCGHCKRYHRSAREVAFCSTFAVTQHSTPAHVAQAKQAAPAHAFSPTPRPNDWQVKTPRSMVENLRDGRYAVSPFGGLDFDHHVFVRVSRPTSGKKKGCLIVQTQHSDAYKGFLVIYPNGSVWFQQSGDRLDRALMMVAADPYTSAMTYGRLKKVCSRCGKQLTDERSRYYGIGPECEKHWPEIINLVNEAQGVFHG